MEVEVCLHQAADQLLHLEEDVNMTNQQKAALYDQLVRESDALQRKISKLKSSYPINTPDLVEKEIKGYEKEINVLVVKLNTLLSNQ